MALFRLKKLPRSCIPRGHEYIFVWSLSPPSNNKKEETKSPPNQTEHVRHHFLELPSNNDIIFSRHQEKLRKRIFPKHGNHNTPVERLS
uniref:Uncharacterized protein n=1 Tax=Ditylum brightwellii TaxID=49249 RepID=A0A7S4WEK1_9STRA